MKPPSKRSYSGILRHWMFVNLFGDFNRLAAERNIPFAAAGRGGIDNHADAFRHAFVSATLTCRFYFSFEIMLQNKDSALHTAEVWADFLGFCRKHKLPRGKSDANMDLWNEEIGREIAISLTKNGIIHRDLSCTQIQKILADNVADAVKDDRTMNAPDSSRPYASRFMKIGERNPPSLSTMFRIACADTVQKNVQPQISLPSHGVRSSQRQRKLEL